MADDYQVLLATRLFHEQRPVSFLWLSRTLAIHVNKAKCLLYEFHQQQNQKSGAHCEAIYCVSGTPLKTPKAPRPATASAPSDCNAPPLLPPGLAHAFVLTTEEALEATKALFQAVTGEHIWGLQAKVPQDPAVLYAAALDERADYEADDLADELRQRNHVSAVTNANVQVGGRGESLQGRMLVVQKSRQEEAKPTPKGEIPLKREPSAMPVEPVLPETAAKSTKPAPKRQAQTTMPKAPAKPKAAGKSRAVSNKKSASPEPTSTADADTSAKENNVTMKVDKASNEARGQGEEEDGDDNGGEEAIQVHRRRPKLSKRSRVAIQDESDDDDDSGPPAGEQPPSSVAASEAATSATSAMAKPRKRRKVKKTHTYQDEHGYLVTEEKDDWETCSEADEPVAPPTKPPPSAQPK
ncbi:hypothetical protein H4R34_000255 [Dimargaris verticillata]|uniref:DNA polymerase delta subunit 3 n=1 Tax=Dimargaris verticillata TaxID=2761393 RepID=A0A9W8EBH5_9FUNG|nr:hypothetical protein H4R34_000255 [Dimargaris verticillata]